MAVPLDDGHDFLGLLQDSRVRLWRLEHADSLNGSGGNDRGGDGRLRLLLAQRRCRGSGRRAVGEEAILGVVNERRGGGGGNGGVELQQALGLLLKSGDTANQLLDGDFAANGMANEGGLLAEGALGGLSASTLHNALSLEVLSGEGVGRRSRGLLIEGRHFDGG